MDIFILQETKTLEDVFQSSIHKWARWPSMHSLAQGAFEGLVTLWNPNTINVKPHKNENYWQLVEVTRFELMFGLLNVYGPTSTIDKKNIWDEITRKIGSLRSRKIVIAGDFNAITSL